MQNKDPNKIRLKHKIRGASMVEYVLGLSLLIIALTVVPVANGLSAVELLELALKSEYTAYSKSIASPR